MSSISVTGTKPYPAPTTLPVLTVDVGPGSAAAQATERRAEIRSLVDERGAVMVRGLGLASAEDVAAVADALGVRRMTERERFAPRKAYAEGVYSGSEWPADEPMCMHHELSYADEIPALLLFGCLTAALEGGETEVADSQAVLRALPSGLVDRFTRDGWLLKRMYHEVGVSWSEGFGTGEPAEVDAYCETAGLEHEWLPDGRLVTRQRRSATLRHPRNGAVGWFNQIAFLNGLTLDPEIRGYLVDVYGPAGLPFDTAYGTGAPVSAETVETINEVYRGVAVGEPWQDGDLLVVDNLRMAHGRAPYRGAREIVAILGDPVRLPDRTAPSPQTMEP